LIPKPMAARADIEQEYLLSGLSLEEIEKQEIMYMHQTLSESEDAFDGWNWIKERFVRKLHETLFKSDNEYRDNTSTAILNGYPFCPFEGRVAFWISIKDFRGGAHLEHPMEGLCLSCFRNKVYHKVMTVAGTELSKEDRFTLPWRIVCGKAVKKAFFKDDGHSKKVQKQRMKLHALINARREKRFFPLIIGEMVI